MRKLRAKLGPKPKMILWPKCKEVEETVKKRDQAPWLDYLSEAPRSIADEGCSVRDHTATITLIWALGLQVRWHHSLSFPVLQ